MSTRIDSNGYTLHSESKITVKGPYTGNKYDTEEPLEIYAQVGFVVPHKISDFEELPGVYGLMEKGMC